MALAAGNQQGFALGRTLPLIQVYCAEIIRNTPGHRTWKEEFYPDCSLQCHVWRLHPAPPQAPLAHLLRLGEEKPPTQSLDGPWWSLRTFWGVVSHTLPFHSGKQAGWNRCSCVFFLVRKVGIQSCICFCFVVFLHFAFGCLGSSKHCRRVPKHRLILGPVHLDVSSVAWHIQQWAARTYAMDYNGMSVEVPVASL